MSEPFIAEVRIFPINFAPRGWAFCDGQLVPISENTALYSLIGITYGGDGRNVMGLPDLQARAAMHSGNGIGLTPRRQGEISGTATVTLTESQTPSHTHAVTGLLTRADLNVPQKDAYMAADINKGQLLRFVNTSPTPHSTIDMSDSMLSSAGGGQRHENQQPYLGLNFCIALTGLYPARN